MCLRRRRTQPSRKPELSLRFSSVRDFEQTGSETQVGSLPRRPHTCSSRKRIDGLVVLSKFIQRKPKIVIGRGVWLQLNRLLEFSDSSLVTASLCELNTLMIMRLHLSINRFLDLSDWLRQRLRLRFQCTGTEE